METMRENRPKVSESSKFQAYMTIKGLLLKSSDGTTSEINLQNQMFWFKIFRRLVCMSPGTEPRCIYYVSNSLENAENKLSKFKNEILNVIRPLLD